MCKNLVYLRNIFFCLIVVRIFVEAVIHNGTVQPTQFYTKRGRMYFAQSSQLIWETIKFWWVRKFGCTVPLMKIFCLLNFSEAFSILYLLFVRNMFIRYWLKIIHSDRIFSGCTYGQCIMDNIFMQLYILHHLVSPWFVSGFAWWLFQAVIFIIEFLPAFSLISLLVFNILNG